MDKHNGNHLWWEDICKEMKNVRIDFDIFYGEVNNLKGYHFVECHIVFDIKMGENS